ncbi:hypothetical protein AGR7C_Cc170034 [Agrobacterium deltaense Zutra 3/1]|uniref:Uncharacterized protein n=1 Tax=Agrobacterium deltaense Zutra 3/1 TaxID=1183427 RepID=A0A1S7PS72_9HYPH|nr:hypothetical protein AGR7C_Cc170034 [Agrobacterium deltaense Zutra 3/1]
MLVRSPLYLAKLCECALQAVVPNWLTNTPQKIPVQSPVAIDDTKLGLISKARYSLYS